MNASVKVSVESVPRMVEFACSDVTHSQSLGLHRRVDLRREQAEVRVRVVEATMSP